jgi:multicomponent Na+:H+ antiporter subunit B
VTPVEWMVETVDIALLILLAVTGVTIIRLRNLIAAVMMAGIYSLLSAGLFVVMDAVDVAFTEAAVGAGISTVLMLGTLSLVGHTEREPSHRPILPLFVVLVTGAALVYGTSDIPPFGDPTNPIHHHVADYYLEESEREIDVPNVVTSILASYRGYDTMGETTVIFAAMVGVLLLLARGPLPRRVFHAGRWITVKPGTTREELEAELVGDDGQGSVDGVSGTGGRTDGSGARDG